MRGKEMMETSDKRGMNRYRKIILVPISIQPFSVFSSPFYRRNIASCNLDQTYHQLFECKINI